MAAPKYHSEILDGETNQDWFYAEVKKNGRLICLDESDKECDSARRSLRYTLRRNWADKTQGYE
jgi:hypothetical protein